MKLPNHEYLPCWFTQYDIHKVLKGGVENAVKSAESGIQIAKEPGFQTEVTTITQ